MSAVAVLGGCAGSESTGSGTAPAAAAVPPVIQRLLADHPAPATDVIAVWVCDVPTDTTVALYGDLPLRLALDPAAVAEQLDGRIAQFWATVSHGAYRPRVVAGGTVRMAAEDTDQECVDRAIDRASNDTTVVLGVATAEHAGGQPGGWGTPGDSLSCSGSCSARLTRRAAYVGASDFSPDWGPVPLLDLIEHELGHALGMPHSGVGGVSGEEYQSAIDLMSNSAAPRDVDADRLDGPDLIGVNRLDVGWLPLADVVVAQLGRDVDADLVPSTGPSGTRLLVLPVDEHRVVTVELLEPTGYDAHLPGAGVAVHLIDDGTGTVLERVQQPLHGPPPYTALLHAGAALDVPGWRIEVRSLGSGTARVAALTTDR